MLIRVLGPVAVEDGGVAVSVGGPRQRRLLALLVTQRGRPLSTERLVDALWPEGDAPDGAARSLRTYLSRLRSAIPNASITSASAGYVLDLDGARVDLHEFDHLVATAEGSVPDRALGLYDEALALWRGDPFGEFAEEWWALPESSRLQARRLSAELGRAAARMSLGHHDRAIPDLERLVVEHPFDERAVTMLMQALHATGRQAESLRAGRAFRRRLADETGLDPSTDFVQLESAIVTGADLGTSELRPLRGYTIHDAIGEGAHGRVFAATQPGTDRPVAIKVIRPELADSTEFIVRFEAEARLVARLEHPHIVPLYDFWREPGGAYLVFRLLTGGTARESVISGGPWSLPRVAQLVEEIGGALIAAHAAGVVHHDVRSSNVLLDDDGATYLMDFGIAGPSGSTNQVIDVRDLGWLAWEMLAGSVPRRDQVVPSLIGRMPAVPEGLDAVLRRAIDGGYASIMEFLLGWRAATDVTHHGPSPMTSSARRAAAHRLTLSATAGVNPFCGLRSFDEADAHTFFGRDRAVLELTDLVAAQPFVVVVGSSGSGKSSVVHAGLVPQLRARGHVVVSMVPGEDPLRALGLALSEVATLADDEGDMDLANAFANAFANVARRLGRVVVVIDQFEECWTRASHERRDQFLAVVADALDATSVDVRFVATVRADLLDRPLEHPAIGQHVGDGSYVLAPLTPSELEDAIVEPAARVGVSFEEGVVSALIAEAVTYPGSLPLLQFTLTELYDRRSDGTMTCAALDVIGGMAGAVGRRAEVIYGSLPAARRPDVRELFGRLVTPGRGSPDTRRRARYSELSAGGRDVADEFVSARLLVTDRDPITREPTIEVAHEALLVRWSRLASWVEEDRRWLDQLQHLSGAARAWDEAGRQGAELYRGARLESAIEAVEVEGRSVSDLERTFIEAGRSARDAEVVEARRTARRLRRRLVAVAIALVCALAGGVIAVVQRNDAQEAEEEAEAAAREARIEALVGRAESIRQTQRDTAALLAIEAFHLADTPRTRSALLATFTDDSRFYDAHRLAGEAGGAGIVMPDGERAYLVGSDGRPRPYGLEDGSLGSALPRVGDATDRASILAASADGRLLAQAARTDLDVGPTTVGIFDTATHSLRFAPIVVDGTVWSLAFTADGSRLALAVGEEAELVVVDSASGAELASADGVQLPPPDDALVLEPQSNDGGRTRRPSAVAISDDELLVASADGTLRVFDAETTELRRTITVAPNTVTSIRPLGDGTLLTAGRRGFARVDLTTGTSLWRHDQEISAVGDGASAAACSILAVIESGDTFFCGNSYGRLTERDLATGFAVAVLDAQNGNSGSLWPARDGSELVAFGDNEAVVSRWRLDGSGPVTHLVAPGFRGWNFSPSGDQLIVERGNTTEGFLAKVVDSATGQEVRSLDGLLNADWIDDDSVGGALVNEDGNLETAHVELPDGPLSGDGFIIDPVPNGAYLDPGTERVLAVFRNGAETIVRQFDPATQQPGPMIVIEDFVSSAISRTGHRIAAGSDDGIVVYDGYTGQQVGSIPGTDLRGVFITVTDQLFVSSLGGELTQYDLETLRPLRTFGGSRGHVRNVRGTADGSLVAVHGGDQTVILYDVASGTRVGTPIVIPEDGSNWMALSIDGRWLSIGGEPGYGQRATQIWDLDPQHWVDAACRLAGRNLTSAEWATNIGDLAPQQPTCPEFPAA